MHSTCPARTRPELLVPWSPQPLTAADSHCLAVDIEKKKRFQHVIFDPHKWHKWHKWAFRLFLQISGKLCPGSAARWRGAPRA